MRALVLSCGPSLNQFDGKTAGYDVVIGVNDAVSRFPCDWWVFGDDETIARNKDRLAADVRKLFLKRRPIHFGFDARCGVEESKFVDARHWRRWVEFEDWPRTIMCYSGPMALILAHHLGADEVDVWGVDMGGQEDFESDGSHAIRTDERWAKERAIWSFVENDVRRNGVVVTRRGL